MFSKVKKVVQLALVALVASVGISQQAQAAETTGPNSNEFILDVVQEVIGLEVTVTSPEGNYLGQTTSIETSSPTSIKRNLKVRNIGNVGLKVTGYADPVIKDGEVYDKQSDFDVKYNFNGLKYSSLSNGTNIENAKQIHPRLEKETEYNSTLDFSILNQVEVGQYKFAFYHIGEYAGKK